MAKYRGTLRLLEQLRAQHPQLPPGALGSVLAAIDERAGQEVARSARRGRRAALVGAGALAAMGTAATVALVAARSRSARAGTSLVTPDVAADHDGRARTPGGNLSLRPPWPSWPVTGGQAAGGQ